MFKYSNGILKIAKVDIPSLEVNIMSDLQTSYRTYLDETIYEDMQYFVNLLHEYQGMSAYELTVRVGNLITSTVGETQTSDGKCYFPVYGYFTLGGSKVTDEFELLDIPYMDDYGKINVNGMSKVVVSVLRTSDDVSYNLKTNTFNISMPYANIRIVGTNKGVKLRYGKRAYDIMMIIGALLHRSGETLRCEDVFTNTFLINALNMDENVDYENLYTAIVKETASRKLDDRSSSMDWEASSLIGKLMSDQYKLGSARDFLNEVLTLDRAVGQTLSRPVLNYAQGSLITQSMVDEFRKNGIHCIQVYNYFLPEGYHLSDEYFFNITTIPAGTRNCDILRRRLPQYVSHTYIPEQVVLDIPIMISNDKDLESEDIELLINLGLKTLNVCAGKSKKVIRFSFEREIVDNYMVKLGDVVDDIPDGREADEWVYTYNNPNFNKVDTDHLTGHDFIAIVSVIGQILLTGKSQLLDRDTSFLKKVLMINEIFSETLRNTLAELVHKRSGRISSNLQNNRNPIGDLNRKWMFTLNSNRYLATADTVNIAAEVSQVNHITTLIPNDSEVVDEQRHLAMPFFGRICPYETPAGKKLGLVNTKAIGARVENGLLTTPYRKILSTATGIRVSESITYLSVKDELGCKFGDMLSFKTDDNGNILNTYVLARVPNPEASDEPFVFKNIKAFDLAGGYVHANPEQFLSPTVALMPYCCCDDPVRISYGASQIRQAIYLINSQRARVFTSMSKSIFSYSESERYQAPCDGTVSAISNYSVTIKMYDNTEKEVKLQSSKHTGNLDVTMDLLCAVGDTVKKGQCIAEAHKYPQPFVVRAPYDCYILDISDSSITVSKNHMPGDFIDLGDGNTDTIAMRNGRVMGQSVVILNIHVSVGDYVRKGQIIADTCMSRDGFYTPSRSPLVAYSSEGYNYEDGVLATERASINYTSVIAHSIEQSVKKGYYPFSRAVKTKGFKYCAPGDVIGEIKQRKSVNQKDGNSVDVRATIKAHGIPFQVRSVEDTAYSKKYKFYLLGFNKLGKGDKMSGMHGNKGVVSRVLPDSKALQLSNGMTVEFVLNPCGVSSRMNLGQIMECHTGLIAEVLDIYIETDPFNGATVQDITNLMRYTWMLANTASIGDNVTKKYNRAAFDAVCSGFPMLPKELHEDVWNNIERIIDWRGVFDIDGSAYLYDPITDTYLNDKCLIGFPQFNKLMQEGDEKVNYRAGILEEMYSRTTSQPQKGPTSAKGQRMAEMEFMAMSAMGMASYIDETLNTAGDNLGRKTNDHLSQLGLLERVPDESCTSRAVENLLYLLEGCGVKFDVPDSVADVSLRTSMDKKTIQLQKIIFDQLRYKSDKSETRKYDNASDFENLT